MKLTCPCKKNLLLGKSAFSFSIASHPEKSELFWTSSRNWLSETALNTVCQLQAPEFVSVPLAEAGPPVGASEAAPTKSIPLEH